MLDSMQRYATDDATLVVEQAAGGTDILQRDEPVSAGYATRSAIDLDGISLPVDE